MIYWTRRQSGVPVAKDFDITAGFGTAIIIDELTDTAYYLTTAGEVKALGGARSEAFVVVCSSEYGTLEASTSLPKVTFRMPYEFVVTEIRAELTSAQLSGATLTVDVRKTATSLFTTLITINNAEKTSVTAATPAVFAETPPIIGENEVVTIWLTQVGDSGASGLKVTIIGFQGA